MVADLLLRYTWVVVLVLRTYYGNVMDSYKWVLFLVIVSKLLRRCIWNIFKLETEHLTNAEGYRATRNMPLPYKSTSLVPINEDSKKVAAQIIAKRVAVSHCTFTRFDVTVTLLTNSTFVTFCSMEHLDL